MDSSAPLTIKYYLREGGGMVLYGVPSLISLIYQAILDIDSIFPCYLLFVDGYFLSFGCFYLPRLLVSWFGIKTPMMTYPHQLCTHLH